MLEYLLEPFSYEYMQKAMWISTAVGGICAFLSAYLMLKGWSLIGDALSHSVVPGVAIAYAFSLPYALGAFFAGIFGRAFYFMDQIYLKTQRRCRYWLYFQYLFCPGIADYFSKSNLNKRAKYYSR